MEMPAYPDFSPRVPPTFERLAVILTRTGLPDCFTGTPVRV